MTATTCDCLRLWGLCLQKINLWNDPQRQISLGVALQTHPSILVFSFYCCHWSPLLWLSLSPSKHVTINHLLFSPCLCCSALPLSLFPLPPWELGLTMHNRISGSVRLSFQRTLLCTYNKMSSLCSYKIFFFSFAEDPSNNWQHVVLHTFLHGLQVAAPIWNNKHQIEPQDNSLNKGQN